MAPRSDAVARQRQESITFMKELIGACGRKILGDEPKGNPGLNEPADCVTVEEAIGAPAISAELEQLLSHYKQSRNPAEKAWAQLAGNTATFGTCLAGLLRQAFGAEGCGPFYASVRDIILKELVNISQEDAKCPGFVWQVLGPVLLGMDTLECYSSILAEAAEQLRPAAVLQLATDFQCSGAVGASGADQLHVSAAAAGSMEGQQTGPPDPVEQQQGEQKRQGYWHEAPSLEDLEKLVREPIALFVVLGMAVSGSQHAPANTACGRTRNSAAGSSSKDSGKRAGINKGSDGEGSGDTGGDGTATGSSSSSSGGAGCSKGSTSGGEGSNGGGDSGGAKPPFPGARSMLTWTGAKLQSSYVLEHWSRLLLLGTSAALARGDSTQQRGAQALQARSLHALSNMSLIMGVGWEGLVRRPCGAVLAATHMAYMCAALDGGGAFGLARPAEIVLPACGLCVSEYDEQADPAALSFDADLAKRGYSVGLRPAMYILKAWKWLLRSEGFAMPLAGGGVGQGGDGRSSAAAPPQQQGDGAGERGPEEEGQAHRGQGLPGAGSCALPPYNRSATVALCLRLAKGVLARWGEAIPGARLDTAGGDGGGGGSSGSSSGGGPQLPKVGGCAVLYEALACSRLALLQAVQGREHVPRRTREQLRAWWETYVAAAQHPEALAVGEPEDGGEDEHGEREAGPPVRPSADTVAALEAGVLPCMARLVTRMGAGTNEGAVRSPQDDYPAFQLSWGELMLYGPVGQVGELVAATGRRVRLAVGELRAVVAAAGKAGRRRGRSVEWLAEVTDEVLTFAQGRLRDVGYEVLGCGQHAGGTAGRRRGRSVGWLTEALSNLLDFANTIMEKSDGKVPGCGEVVGGGDQQRGGVGREGGAEKGQGAAGAGGASGPADADGGKYVGSGDQQRRGAEEEQGAAGAGGASSPVDAGGGQRMGGGDQQRTGAEEEQGAAGAGGPLGLVGAVGGQQARKAVRYSYAVAELLPQISSGVQLCAELDTWEEDGGGHGPGHEAVGDAASEASAQLTCCVSPCIHTALECTNLLLAKHIRTAAEQHGAVAGAGDGGGAGSSSSGGGGGGVARSALAGGGPDAPWRLLLLGDVRLMGLLGAAVQLWGKVEAEYMWAKHVAQDDHDVRQCELMRKQLSAAMVLAAVAFPAEFRAAAGGKRAAAAAAEPRAVPAAAATAGKRGAGGAGGGSGRSNAPTCIDLADARAVMGDAGFADSVAVADRVLGGWEPTAGEAWGLASSCLGRCGVAAEELPGILAALVPPAEARAAVAAAAAV